MNSSHDNYIRAKEILKDYVNTNNKFENRFVATLTNMQQFVEQLGCSSQVDINELLLGYTLVDYFEDVRRLKLFHQVDHINSVKVVAYTSYWILRRKPIQVKALDKNLLYVNEQYVLAYILDFLSSEQKGLLITRENSGLESFVKSLFYFLKYRAYSAQSIELFIMSFFAGQIYQETDTDLSDFLPPSDHEL